ncbi:SHOCT domain-containing protein [Lentzea sp. NPDC054927]
MRNATTPAQAPRQDVLAQISKLADLHAAGILTAEEFQSKKTELLNRL